MPPKAPGKAISIRGAREHNLRDIDVDIPRDKMVVVTGLSGSGKSSLAFDTIYAEGQRKYVESLSAYARQFLDQLQKPDIESIEGLPPTIAIEQRSASHNPRSTVATTTEIYDYLRLLFARVGTARCWYVDDKSRTCGNPIAGQSATMIVDQIMALSDQTRLMVLSPLVRYKKGHHREVFDGMLRQGFVRARVDGDVIDLRDLKGATPFTTQKQRYQNHTIEAVVDRIVIRHDDDSDIRTRVADSVELSLKLSGGLVVVSVQNDGDTSDGGASASRWEDVLFSEHYACPIHPECNLEEIEPRLFSFNSPYGACSSCDGLGTILEFDPDLIVPDPSVCLTEGAIDAWRHSGKRMNIYYNRLVKRFCRDFGVKATTPYVKLPKTIRRILLDGTNARDEAKYDTHFEGVVPNLQRRWEKTDSEYVKARLHSYLSEAPCEQCRGGRLRTEALHVFIEGAVKHDGGRRLGDFRHPDGGRKSARLFNVNDATAMTIEEATDFFGRLQLTAEQEQIAAPILKEVRARLGFMMDVGLGYLSLNRSTGTLSGGEGQRIRLATQVGSGLVGCCYVLDEPTIGLHQRDNRRLISTLRHLTDIGNTVIVVEHDEEMIRAADYLIDIGPGPGRHGGTVVTQGTVRQVERASASITGRYLTGKLYIDTPLPRRRLDHKKLVTVRGARQNNLKSVDVSFPLGGILCVTGVSGSGKSTLVNQILLRAVRRHLYGSRDKPGAHDRVTGLGNVDRIIEVNQSPIGRTPRSNPATYTGAFDAIRDLFTKTREAKIRGYKPGRFSFNVKGGRCEACQGQGVKKIEMHFLPDVYVTCDQCKGKRYNRETLEITYRTKSIADVLAMTIEEGFGFFENFPVVRQLLGALSDVGLGYVQLGQSSTTLSGGEAQRVKLATELGKRPTGHTLYVLDEPTTGLHFADTDKLLGVLAQLADQGNTVVVIEHNMDVIKCADWLIDLGPEGGDRGGMVVAQGTPEQVAATPGSYTGDYLKRHLGASLSAAGDGLRTPTRVAV
ncbi:MAG: excinuclease ABC subunit UvrA [Phycisphaeraceae bacterium]|nr:excinuclease ABC subunit UvrA [Phycisphaeraceae bacterium]